MRFPLPSDVLPDPHALTSEHIAAALADLGDDATMVVCTTDSALAALQMGDFDSSRWHVVETGSAAADLLLLSLCDHNILDVSTFSLWSGILGSGSVRFPKAVIDYKFHRCAGGIIPNQDRWRLIDVKEPTIRKDRRIHLIVQPYVDPHPERAAEIELCLRRNLMHPRVSKVHILLEEGSKFSVPLSDKAVVVRNEPRMTFARAIAYANVVVPHGEVAFILNGDIYLDDGCIAPLSNWSSLCDDGEPLLQSRWELHPWGELSIIVHSLWKGNSADGWAFVTPIPEFEDVDFRVGNELHCDGAMFDRTVRAGLSPSNQPVRFPLVHVDACAHRDRLEKCHFSETENHSAEETKYDSIPVEQGEVTTLPVTIWHDELHRLRACDQHRLRSNPAKYLKAHPPRVRIAPGP